MPSENPEYSIIIPAHNESKTIAKTIEAILTDDISYNYEIIVACNGCTDDTEQVCKKYHDIRVISSEKSGMSFGKNFGASRALGNFLIFIDADTILPKDGINNIIGQIKDIPYLIGTVAGKADRGGIVVKTCFLIANLNTRKNKLHAPGGVMLMQKQVFDDVGGFNEDLPQGTSTDIILRAREEGAKYVFIKTPKATTSIRRFEKTGIIWQMLDWRKNHKNMHKGRHNNIKTKDYKAFR